MIDVDLALSRFVSGVDAEGLRALGVVIRVGDQQRQHRWRNDDRTNIYSVSKGVSVLAAGLAFDEELLTPASRVGQLLPAASLGADVDGVTIEHLLSMTSGIDFPWFESDPWPEADLAHAMLSKPSRGPGLVFQYSDASTYVAMRMLGAIIGDVRDWLIPRLFTPLGIDDPEWHRCPRGWIIAGSGLELRTEELASVGQLLRDRGMWNGRQLISAQRIDRMHSSWIDTGGPAPFTRYGLAGWDGPRDCWRLDGARGQYVVVDAARDAVITITADEPECDHRLAELAADALLG
ncbi:serine hydrolase [Rathayibacter sp. AY1D3]|uniref:serine hydrolase domain-containing protein n=1 Tax=Rathayibacter sp. AY1D3 TaxID=2080544 RepID=UPI000CE90FF9|nr:serine hydrolase domain-containing protein [Rathayibacter sp. AY1D3]PPH85282.1 hydrolase [Rathayibacter sp. AY1D3]